VEAGPGGRACFRGLRASKQDGGNETAGCLDEVGTGNEEKCHLAGLLSIAKDWVKAVDVERQLKISVHKVQTSLRPDTILVSEATRQLVLLELTVPWEERMAEAQERKRAKYQELVEDCRRNRWRTRCMPVEVGICRPLPQQGP